MPRISEFYGICIYMYWRDHAPPHFHAVYAQYEAEVSIETGELLRGHLPRRARRLVRTWTLQHVDELRSNWTRATDGEALRPIEPLE